MERCVPRRRKALGRTRENFEGSSEPEVLRRYLSDHGLKMTTQREKILEVFLETQGHVTAEQLYDRLKRIDPSIGFTTVYRSPRLLGACGLARERSFVDS